MGECSQILEGTQWATEVVQIDSGPQGWTHFNIFIIKFSLSRRTPLIKTPAPPPSMSMIQDDYSGGSEY